MLQRKPAVSEPGDLLEREADRVAEQVVSAPAAGGPALRGVFPSAQAGAAIQRACSCGGACAECREEEKPLVQRKASAESATCHGETGAPPIVEEVLRSPGRPLDAATRAFMEPRFGRDFSYVRVHTDMRAAQSAVALNALAYTSGWDIAFAPGQFQTGDTRGRQLLAHELTHVVQQTSAAPSLGSRPGGQAGGSGIGQPMTRATAGAVQRQIFLPPVQSGGFGGAMERDRYAHLSPFVAPAAPGPMPAIPAGSPHAALPRPLLEALWRSYARRVVGVAGADKNLDNAFWGGRPKDFWDALDRLARDGALPIIREIYSRWTAAGVFWGHLVDLRNTWGGGSRGFDFRPVSVPALADQLRSSTRFCQDIWWTGGLYHFKRGETPCWRENVSCAPGLHFCLGSSPPSVHIDPTQVIEKREADGTCNYDLGCVYGHFKDLGWVP